MRPALHRAASEVAEPQFVLHFGVLLFDRPWVAAEAHQVAERLSGVESQHVTPPLIVRQRHSHNSRGPATACRAHAQGDEACVLERRDVCGEFSMGSS